MYLLLLFSFSPPPLPLLFFYSSFSFFHRRVISHRTWTTCKLELVGVAPVAVGSRARPTAATLLAAEAINDPDAIDAAGINPDAAGIDPEANDAADMDPDANDIDPDAIDAAEIDAAEIEAEGATK